MNDTNNSSIDLEKKYKPVVVILSIAIPLLVMLLFKIKIDGYDLTFLPPIYATINGIVAVLLVLAVIAIKNKNRRLHQRLIQFAMLGSALFLIGYVTYHITSDSTTYGIVNEDGVKTDLNGRPLGFSLYIYLFILISHI